MKGNTGRLKRSSSRRWKLAIVVLGVASPFALYRLVNGGGNETGERFLDLGLGLGRREGGRGFGASHAKGHAAGGHATYHGQKNYGGFENGIAGITNHNPSVWDAGSNPKDHRPRFERDVSPPAPDYGVPHTIGTSRADTRPGHVGGFVSNGDDRRHIDAHRTHPASKFTKTKTEPVVFDDDLLDDVLLQRHCRERAEQPESNRSRE